MTQIDAKDAEEYVRAQWLYVRHYVRDLDSYGTDQFNVEIFAEKPEHYRLSQKDHSLERPLKYFQEDYNKSHLAWLAAYNFTLEREQAIREKQEEIDWLVDRDIPIDKVSTAQRILSVLTAQLDDLKRGMR